MDGEVLTEVAPAAARPPRRRASACRGVCARVAPSGGVEERLAAGGARRAPTSAHDPAGARSGGRGCRRRPGRPARAGDRGAGRPRRDAGRRRDGLRQGGGDLVWGGAAVQRDAGRVENCQVGCSWATPARRGGRGSTGRCACPASGRPGRGGAPPRPVRGNHVPDEAPVSAGHDRARARRRDAGSVRGSWATRSPGATASYSLEQPPARHLQPCHGVHRGSRRACSAPWSPTPYCLLTILAGTPGAVQRSPLPCLRQQDRVSLAAPSSWRRLWAPDGAIGRPTLGRVLGCAEASPQIFYTVGLLVAVEMASMVARSWAARFGPSRPSCLTDRSPGELAAARPAATPPAVTPRTRDASTASMRTPRRPACRGSRSPPAFRRPPVAATAVAPILLPVSTSTATIGGGRCSLHDSATNGHYICGQPKRGGGRPLGDCSLKN